MTSACPKCGSFRVSTRNLARKTGGSIGTAAGAAGGFVAATNGARIGTTVGLMAGPTGAIIGGVSGALLGAFMGGIAGGGVGIKLGELVDNNILDNCQCDECGNRFSQKVDTPFFLDHQDWDE